MRIVEEFSSGVVLVKPEIFRDSRGYFFESFNQASFDRLVSPAIFVQDNQSQSRCGVLRGLHYQLRQPQGKLVRVLSGEIFDVAVDLRRNSPSFGRWDAVKISSETGHMIWIPPGFAHGFLVLSSSAEVHYKTTAYYAPSGERTIRWNDPDLAIQWPLSSPPILSEKDQSGSPFRDAEVYEWPGRPLATLADVCTPFKDSPATPYRVPASDTL